MLRQLSRTIFSIFAALIVLSVALDMLNWSFTGSTPEASRRTVSGMLNSIINLPIKLVAFALACVFFLLGAVIRVPFALLDHVLGTELAGAIQLLGWDEVIATIRDSDNSLGKALSHFTIEEDESLSDTDMTQQDGIN